MARPFRVFDSDLDEEYPDHSMYAMAYEPVWQSMRASCRGKWGQLASARACCARLELYMHRNTSQLAVRTWRVYNLLNAVPYNQTTSVGIHAIEYAAADFLIEYRIHVADEFHKMKPPTEWDWAISRHGLEVLWRRNPDWALYLFHDLKNGRARNRAKPELVHYLFMCAETFRKETDE